LPDTVEAPEPGGGILGGSGSRARSRGLQSTTMVSPNDPTITFDGLRSRWITDSLWA
jgi:hypothetical protein